LKLDNVLVAADGATLKLCDFGLAKPCHKSLSSRQGTRQYMAPEVLAEKEYHGEKADLFALGVMIFEMRAKCFPHKGEASPRDDRFKYVHSKRPTVFWNRLKSKVQPSEHFKDLVFNILAREFTIAKAIGHNFTQLEE
jgi:serine/threonine protein kinase